MPIIAAAVIAGTGAIVASKVQADAAKKANRTQKDIANEQLNLQLRAEKRAEPFVDLAQQGVESIFDLAAGVDFERLAFLRTQNAAKFQRDILSSSGNLPSSGVSQDLILRTGTDELSRAFEQQAGLLQAGTGLASGQGQFFGNQAQAFSQSRASALGNVSSLQLAQGNAQAGIFSGAGNALSSGLLAHQAFGGGPAASPQVSQTGGGGGVNFKPGSLGSTSLR